eukprot:5487518-Prymnesium_polylepis.2
MVDEQAQREASCERLRVQGVGRHCAPEQKQEEVEVDRLTAVAAQAKGSLVVEPQPEPFIRIGRAARLASGDAQAPHGTGHT